MSDEIKTASASAPAKPVGGSHEPPVDWEPATRFYRQMHVWALGLLIIALLIHFLREFAEVLQQVFIAGFLVYLILPLQRWLLRRGLPLLPAYAVILALALALMTGLGFIMHANFQDLLTKIPEYRRNLEIMTTEALRWLPESVAQNIEKALLENTRSAEQNLRTISGMIGTVLGLFTKITLVIIYLLFLLWELAGFRRRIDAAFAPERAANLRQIIAGASADIENYVNVKTLVSLILGVLTSVTLAAFGVDYPILWGIVAFLLNYIPYLGSIIAVILPVALALVQLRSPGAALVILLVLTVLHNVIGFVVEPLLAGHRLNLSPLLILIALAFWFTIWGIPGMILAVPLLVVAKSILANVKETRPLAVMMSN